jgi:hypothetical protein
VIDGKTIAVLLHECICMNILVMYMYEKMTGGQKVNEIETKVADVLTLSVTTTLICGLYSYRQEFNVIRIERLLVIFYLYTYISYVFLLLY